MHKALHYYIYIFGYEEMEVICEYFNPLPSLSLPNSLVILISFYRKESLCEMSATRKEYVHLFFEAKELRKL